MQDGKLIIIQERTPVRKRAVWCCSSGRPGMSEEKVEQVRKAFQHSPSKSMGRESQELSQHPVHNDVENPSQTFTSKTVQDPACNYTY